MVSRISKLAVLVMFCTVGISSSTPVSAQTEDVGEWGDILDWDMLAVHMILLNNGKVLCMYDNYDVNPKRFLIFDPAGPDTIQVMTSRPLDPVTQQPFRLFCAGHSQLPDGRIVMAGGGLLPQSSHNHTVIFDPDAVTTPCSIPRDCMAFPGGCNTTDGFCDPWSIVDDMPTGNRWYPTVTTLGDGMALVVAGDGPFTAPAARTAEIPLIFNSTKPADEQYSQVPDAKLYFPFYPFIFQLSDGTILYAGSDTPITAELVGYTMFSKTLDLSDATPTWTDLAAVEDPIMGGSAVMYGPDLIMKAGGFDLDMGSNLIRGINGVYTLDMTSPTPTWTSFAFLNHARKEHYLVALPGGKLLAIGGDRDPPSRDAGDPLVAVLVPEIYDPNDPMMQWEPMAPMASTDNRCSVTEETCVTAADCKVCAGSFCLTSCSGGYICARELPPETGGRCVDPTHDSCVDDDDCPGTDTCESLEPCYDIPRGHHSSALLLPDARVLFAGGDIYTNTHATENLDAQIFSPPYLFTSGGGAATRPIIDEVDGRGSCDFPATDIIAYGKTFTVDFSMVSSIDEVNLIALGAATHSFDQSQRFLNLTFTTPETGVLSVTAPAMPEEAPSGYYMLFILDDNGVPSVASIIKLDPTCPPALPPTAAPAPDDTAKNRYLSFVPNNEDTVAFKLSLVTAPPLRAPPSWWVDIPVLVDGSYTSVLTDHPVYHRWSSTSVVHIGDCPVVPVNDYELRATTDGQTFSAPLMLSTINRPVPKWWGDVVGVLDGDWTPPQGVTNIDDVTATIQGFQEVPTAPPMTWVDVEPEVPNRVVNFNDVLKVLSAFQGALYPFSDPVNCP